MTKKGQARTGLTRFIITWLFLTPAIARGENLPVLDTSFESARVAAKGNRLTVSTGVAERSWQWTGQGLSTVSLKDLRAGRQWVNTATSPSDWHASGLVGDSPGRLLSLTAESANDNGFTSPHLRIRTEILYPSSGIVLRHEVWAYPGAEGLRTQLWIKKAGRPIADPAGNQSSAPSISAISGKPYLAREALKVAPVWHATSLQDKKVVKLRLGGLDPANSYHFGFSWWDYGNGGRKQKVTATSIDGEARKLLAKPTVLPGWKSDKQPASSRVVALPSDVNLDGTVTILVEKIKGPSAVLSESWLYGPGPPPELDMDAKRRSELEKAAPEGTRLIAYFSASNGQSDRNETAEHQVEFLPVHVPNQRAIGYFNDTQHRHNSNSHLLRDEAVGPGRTDWANVLCLEAASGGLAVVKESHKCVNQSGVDTGSFVSGSNGVSVTGWGLPTDTLNSDFRWCWATWTVLYLEPGDDARELALKRFDRTRYPVSPGRDLYMKANTWGSGIDQPASFVRAKEDEVLAEIDSVADLGLDALQIDDGWQAERMKPRDRSLRDWRPRPDWYPDGWKNVADRAKEKGIDLGIWFAARAPVEDLTWSYDQAGFKTYKLDFANLGNYDGVESYLAKGRALVAHSGHRAKVNWDVTENAPRFGYFWARECGSIWLANRKPMQPDNVVPRPWLMLREAWELARYMNANKFELPVQNFRMVNRKVSDAWQHSDTYSVALGLPGIPVFFQTTRLLEEDQRSEIKTLLKQYRAVRGELFKRFVFPVGGEPDNKSWTGFQWVDPDSDTGYLLVFRERLNTAETASLPLRFLAAGARLMVDDLRSGESSSLVLGENHDIPLNIATAGDVLFLRYQR